MGPGQSSKAESSQEEKPAEKGVAQCSSYTVPIEIMDGARRTPQVILSIDKISSGSPHFRAFVTAVTEHVAARMTKENLCVDSTDSNKRSLLQFVNWPLANYYGDEPLVSVPPLDARPSSGCRISSPWIDLVFERKPILSIRAIVRWNDRQLLADQAVLAGARNVPPGVAMPLKRSEYAHFLTEYANSEIRGEPAAKPIEERIPPDMLWLFRHSWQSTRGGGFGPSLREAKKKGADGYTKLVNALIDRCFDSDGAALHYSTILDAADLVPLEYKIDTLTR